MSAFDPLRTLDPKLHVQTVKERWLYLPALTVAALCALVIAVSPFVASVRAVLVRPSIYVAAALAIALFVRMLLDPKCRRGIDAANIELRGGKPWPSGRRIKFSDAEWGLFGSRVGTPALAWVRAALFVEFILAMLLSGRNGSELSVLSFAALAVALLLSIIHGALNTPVRRQ